METFVCECVCLCCLVVLVLGDLEELFGKVELHVVHRLLHLQK